MCSKKATEESAEHLSNKASWGFLWKELQWTYIIGPLPKTPRGNRYVLVISDYFTKWTESYNKKNILTLYFTHVVTSRSIIKQYLCNVPRQNTLDCSCINKPIITHIFNLSHTSHEATVMRFVNNHCVLNYFLCCPFALHQQLGTPLGIRSCLPLVSLLLFP